MRNFVRTTAPLAALASLCVCLACDKSEAAPDTSKPETGQETNRVAGGNRMDAPAFTAEIKIGGPYKAKSEGTFEVVLVPKGEYHINDKYPVKFKTENSDQVTYAKNVLKREDGKFDAKKGTFSVGFTSVSAGKAKVKGTLHLSVCSDANCIMEKVELETDVDVK